MKLICIGLVVSLTLSIVLCSTLAEFTPVPPGDTTPPVISNVTVVYDSAVIITWETHEPSDSTVKWGRVSGHYTHQKSVGEPVLFHSVRLEDLREDGTYYFVVMSTDPSGNTAETPEHRFMLTTAPEPLNKSWIESFMLLLILFFILSTVAVIILTFMIYKYRERAEILKLRTAELKQRVEDLKKIRANVLSEPRELEETRPHTEPGPEDHVEKSEAHPEQDQAPEVETIITETIQAPVQAADGAKELKISKELEKEVIPEREREEVKELNVPEQQAAEEKETKAEVVHEQPGQVTVVGGEPQVEPEPEPVIGQLKEIKANLVAEVKPAKGEKRGALSIDRIQDVIREKKTTLAIRYTGSPGTTAQGEENVPVFTKQLTGEAPVLDKVERKLVLRMKGTTFKVYSLPQPDSQEPEPGLLKIASDALWIIGRSNLKRVASRDLIRVEQVKRSTYQGTEYAALSLEYLDETRTCSTVIIVNGTTVEDLVQHLHHLMAASKK